MYAFDNFCGLWNLDTILSDMHLTSSIQSYLCELSAKMPQMIILMSLETFLVDDGTNR